MNIVLVFSLIHLLRRITCTALPNAGSNIGPFSIKCSVANNHGQRGWGQFSFFVNVLLPYRCAYNCVLYNEVTKYQTVTKCSMTK